MMMKVILKAHKETRLKIFKNLSDLKYLDVIIDHLSTAAISSLMNLISHSRTSILLFIPPARPSRIWLISSCIFTSVSWLKSLRGVKSPRGDFPRSEMEDGDSGLGLSSMVVSCHLSSPLMKLFILRDLDSGVLTWELSPNILSFADR